MSDHRRIAVFCGSSRRVAQHHLDLATSVGRALATNGTGLVYGGGDTGLMGAVADGTMAAGGEVTGVLPAGLFDNGIDQDRITHLELVDDMHQRKMRMYSLADGFLGLPGGLGTLEEVFEAATWSQLGLHNGGGRKPVVLLGNDDYWQPVHDLLDRAHHEGFVSDDARAVIRSAETVDEALQILLATA